jgi:RHS repeat-associated protein
MTDSAGTVVEDSDFYPFGGERVVVDSLNNNYKFAGHERDSESGLDYFIARHYAFTLGRFLQPDLPFADQRPSNPQTWNLYPYARNNPLYFVDPTGRAGCPWNPCTGTDSQGVLSGRWPIMGTVPVHGDIKTVARTFAVVNIAWNSKGTVLAWNITLFGKLLYSPAGEWSYGSSSGPGAAATTSMTPPQPEKAPPNSRTDVVLYGRQWIPKPTRHSVAFWLMDWYAGTCTADGCIQSEENKNQTISLLEAKSKDGPWEPGGDPSKGQASDWISIERRTFYQRWFVDGKQVQLVIGRDRNRDPITTWQLRVVIPKWGERPVYYPVD